nr:immunoglobulin heavy chain junction region [Macaca mulatta]MOV54565.1 immunoglobulin heavy chain junction region [Macaca mulatta]MOV54957.1 immunoglobulin heavy chain junction region [Macaca mulatta]MOV55050.1 immunoglobulin heavy chain junction region [Macaca mulatta]MOV56194.1 immunoglobulin heavy chain junction region [Macaca mulatta]
CARDEAYHHSGSESYYGLDSW